MRITLLFYFAFRFCYANQGCPSYLSWRIDFLKSPFEIVEGRLFIQNLPWKSGKEILPSNSPLKKRKGDSPFKISLWKMEGRFYLINLPSEGRKYFLGRSWNLPNLIEWSNQRYLLFVDYCIKTRAHDILLISARNIDHVWKFWDGSLFIVRKFWDVFKFEAKSNLRKNDGQKLKYVKKLSVPIEKKSHHSQITVT